MNKTKGVEENGVARSVCSVRMFFFFLHASFLLSSLPPSLPPLPFFFFFFGYIFANQIYPCSRPQVSKLSSPRRQTPVTLSGRGSPSVTTPLVSTTTDHPHVVCSSYIQKPLVSPPVCLASLARRPAVPVLSHVGVDGSHSHRQRA